MTLLLFILLTSLLPQLGNCAFAEMGIVNGTEAKPHSRPYMVSIQKYKSHYCGGFLVSPHFVMTAAHCWEKGNTLTVVLGAHSLSASRSASVHMTVKSYHRHPEYDSNEMLNDIMLLQLAKPIKRGPKINWISLPNKDDDMKMGQICSIAGWGKTTENGKPTDRLLEVNVIIQQSKDCAKSWGEPYPVSSLLCTKGVGGFCEGDSGGPLVCNKTAVGIISFFDATDCDLAKKPYVYTKISAFLPWIKDILKKTSI